jgi:glycosyltransferase involved in cell wall biosynthesis
MNQTREQFSFLMCVNKLTPFLELALQSVFNQTESDFRFVVVANNCKDELWHYLQSVKDTRLDLYRTHVGQLAFNLNYGLNVIESGYVLRMDADDISAPNRLFTTKQRLNEYNYPDVLGGAARLIDKRGEEIGVWRPPTSNEEIRKALWRTCPIIHPTTAIRAKSVLALGGYLGGFASEDYDLWLRAARKPRFVFRNASDVFLEYRVHDGQAKGYALGYSEMAGHMLRDSLQHGGWRNWCGACLAILKRFVRGGRSVISE